MRHCSLHRPKRASEPQPLLPLRPGKNSEPQPLPLARPPPTETPRAVRAGPAATGALPPTEPPRAVRAVPAATMQAFLDAWLDELPVPDALRLGAACRRAREALGAGGVAAAAFAVSRPWRAKPEASLRLWRTAWEACASASSALGLHGEAWLKTATLFRPSSDAVTLDFGSAGRLAEDTVVMRNWIFHCLPDAIAILLISGKRARFSQVGESCSGCLQTLLLLENSRFAVVIANSRHEQLTVRDTPSVSTVIADGFDARLLVPLHELPLETRSSDGTIHCAQTICLRLNVLFSDMLRVARDGRAYDIFAFAAWYGDGCYGRERWREAPPLAEVQDEREIALAGMLTRSAPPPAAASGAARGGGAPASGGRTFSERDF